MSTGTLTGTQVWINGEGPFLGEVTTEQEVEYVRSYSATKPDPTWEHTDSNQHFHTWANGGKLPTLDAREEEMACDGSCGGTCSGEGYTVTRYYCSVCGEQVEPRVIPDEEARDRGTPILGPQSWTVTVRNWHYQRSTDQVSVVVRGDLYARPLFGFGYAHNLTAEGGPDGITSITTLHCRLWQRLSETP